MTGCRMASQKHLTKLRRDQSEEVMWTLLIMMELGMLEIPLEHRSFLGEPFEKWADLAVETGKLAEGKRV